ncbi:chemotaxis protein CheW [Deefgea tanakiae]|jgi:purine-binding chemotaxis protein CheW|uniref:Chemotaxis protein CheW n=1 Tax=Deefgea tanakiae TaxID=2865840 RepID=A0ABX8ZDK1_9NEIS|nr:chemotaxis protein CheW [Deefgea tanakiae]QZA79394.1 chemotaxis protein CheW [Deefgea tanakiae]
MEYFKQRALLSACHNGLLTFSLGEQNYALDIIKVQEIRGFEPVTQLANLPDHIKGVINLRGSIVPIVDLRIKLGLTTVNYSATTVVVILSLVDRLIGIVVDAVSDVMEITPEQIKPPPEFGARIDIRYLLGMVTLNEHMVALVDIETLLVSDETQILESIPA